MAVDTAEKRASVIQFAMPLVMVLPVPSGTIAEPERAHLVDMYAGIPAALPSVGSNEYQYFARHKHRR